MTVAKSFLASDDTHTRTHGAFRSLIVQSGISVTPLTFFPWSVFASFSELLRVSRADARSEPVHALQQVALLPVHRCAPAPPSRRGGAQARRRATPERLQLSPRQRTRQDVCGRCRSHLNSLVFLSAPGLCLLVSHVSVGSITMNNTWRWRCLIRVLGGPFTLLHLSLTRGPDSVQLV